jgi:hypothetical protein
MNLSAVSTTQIAVVLAVAVMEVTGIAILLLFVIAERKDYALSLVALNRLALSGAPEMAQPVQICWVYFHKSRRKLQPR